MNLTREQREALKQVYDRGPLVWDSANKFLVTPEPGRSPLTLEAVELSLQPCFGGDGCVLLPWQGMWLGIETDGYTHS